MIICQTTLYFSKEHFKTNVPVTITTMLGQISHQIDKSSLNVTLYSDIYPLHGSIKQAAPNILHQVDRYLAYLWSHPPLLCLLPPCSPGASAQETWRSWQGSSLAEDQRSSGNNCHVRAPLFDISIYCGLFYNCNCFVFVLNLHVHAILRFCFHGNESMMYTKNWPNKNWPHR